MQNWIKGNITAIVLVAISGFGSYTTSRVVTESDIVATNKRIDAVEHVQEKNSVYIVKFNKLESDVENLDGRVGELIPLVGQLKDIIHSLDKTIASATVSNDNVEATLDDVRRNQNSMREAIQDIKIQIAK